MLFSPSGESNEINGNQCVIMLHNMRCNILTRCILANLIDTAASLLVSTFRLGIGIATLPKEVDIAV